MRIPAVALMITLAGCASDFPEPPVIRATEDGSTAALVHIDSSPTEAQT